MRTDPTGRFKTCRAAIAVACLALVLVRSGVASEKPLVLGVLPYLSVQRLVAQAAPLRDHLRQALGRPVTLATAPDYATFVQRTREGDFDVVLTGPHFGRLAERQSGFQRIAMSRYQVRGVIVAPRETPTRGLGDLGGKTLAVPPRSTLVYLLGMELLREQGLHPGREVALLEFDNGENSMMAPLRGDADAGLTDGLVWSSEGRGRSLRVLGKTRAMPGFVLMAHPRVPAAAVATLRKATHTFAATPAGRSYFEATGFGAWLPIGDAEMKRLDPFLDRLAE